MHRQAYSGAQRKYFAMWPNDTLLHRFGIQHPIIQAPMAGASGPELMAAVSNAGGLGSFGAASTTPAGLRETVRRTRELTNRPIHVNLFSQPVEPVTGPVEPGTRLRETLTGYHAELGLEDLPKPSLEFQPTAEQLDVLLDEKVPVISFHFGVDPVLVERAKSRGAVVLCSAITADNARELEAAGVDVIIAQGAEAGGHQGLFRDDDDLPLVGSMALVPRIVDAVSLPVIAAGGIMDARGIVAALALGASGVQMGTAFLGCHEASISPAWKQALADATEADTVVTRAISGRPARGVRNRLIDELEALDQGPLPYPAQYSLNGSIRAAAREKGRAEFMALWSGQGVGLLQHSGAADLLDRLVSECRETLHRLGSASG